MSTPQLLVATQSLAADTRDLYRPRVEGPVLLINSKGGG